MKKITVLFVLVFLFISTAVHAQNGWRFIADKIVAFGVDHDVIVTGNTNDDFRKLKLRVTDGPLKMYGCFYPFPHSAGRRKPGDRFGWRFAPYQAH
jgi:hypothetical protein